MKGWVFSVIAVCWGTIASAGEVTLAVAANFLVTAETLGDAFEAETGHTVVISHGATGLLYSQIVSGAPFDIFLAADEERLERLLEEGRASAVRTYALGQLVLASRVPVTPETAAEAMAGTTVALADPTVAPYGRAATRAMERLGLDTATFRPVLVTNVGQVASVFRTGNADFAFVARSQAERLDPPYILGLEGIAPEIRQDAALLSEDEAALAFWEWLASPTATDLIGRHGYGRP